jgi:phosphate/sulfate permease
VGVVVSPEEISALFARETPWGWTVGQSALVIGAVLGIPMVFGIIAAFFRLLRIGCILIVLSVVGCGIAYVFLQVTARP